MYVTYSISSVVGQKLNHVLGFYEIRSTGSLQGVGVSFVYIFPLADCLNCLTTAKFN